MTSPPKKPLSRRLARGVAVFVLAPYLALVGIVTVAQRSLIYHPKRDMSLNVRPAHVHGGTTLPLSFKAADGVELHGWQITANETVGPHDGAVRRTNGKPVVLYFCGNANHRGHRTDEFALLLEAGADVVCFDYRGYGDNFGSPSEEAIASDAREISKFLVEKQGIDPRRIILCGESLGGGVATRLAADLCSAESAPAGLILRSTFSRLTDAAAVHFPWLPVRLLMFDRYPSADRIPRVTCPILILHGERDVVVPFELGEALFAAAPQKSAMGIAKRFVNLPHSDHNDVLEADGAIVEGVVREFIGGSAKRE